jgi:uncharacterized protein YdiU (UPF0061 family)
VRQTKTQPKQKRPDYKKLFEAEQIYAWNLEELVEDLFDVIDTVKDLTDEGLDPRDEFRRIKRER